ncbi:MAG: type III-B CRISPR module RAMP protein Cmr4 [Deltaproteobacteria bacterium]|nr:type III-B CRISPR module RAMP protein Cmr4 [Deltaproteobacteria bacterium]
MAKYSLMFMSVITPLHNGAGEGQGMVDNPIIRERTTLFPFIQSTSIKGVLRDCFGPDVDPKVQAIFGPPPPMGDSHSGAVNFSDGQLFAFPIRSLKGGFVWATIPLILYRLWRSIEIMRITTDFSKLKALLDGVDASFNNSDRVRICPSGKTALLIGQAGNQRLILEEFPKVTEESRPLEEFAKEISVKIFPSGSTFLKTEFEKKLILLPQNSFTYFVSNATEVTPNIRIGDRGITVKGSLRYTEFLPAESILYSTVTFNKPKEPGGPDGETLLANMKKIKVSENGTELTFDNGEDWVKALFERDKPSTIQIGGDETTGKGLVQLSFV